MKHNSSAQIKTQPFIVKDEKQPVDDLNASFRSESDIASHHSPTAASPETARKRLDMRVPVVVLAVCVGLAGAWFAWQAWAVTPARAERLNPIVAEGTAVSNSGPERAS